MTSSILIAVAAAGAVGALARFGLSRALATVAGDFPLATFTVNVTGCFLFGLLWALHANRWSTAMQAGVFAGFLGAFTTFSTFAFDCAELAAAHRIGALLVNLVGQNVLGVLAVLAGRQVAQWW